MNEADTRTSIRRVGLDLCGDGRPESGDPTETPTPFASMATSLPQPRSLVGRRGRGVRRPRRSEVSRILPFECAPRTFGERCKACCATQGDRGRGHQHTTLRSLLIRESPVRLQPSAEVRIRRRKKSTFSTISLALVTE